MSGYIAVPLKEDLSSDSLPPSPGSEGGQIELAESTTRRTGLWKKIWPWCLHLAVFTLSISAGLLVKPKQTCFSTEDVLLHDHPWDQTIRFEGSLRRTSSPYKGPPTKEVDELWKKLVPERIMVIAEPTFQKINASQHSAKAPSYLGTGRLAAFEGFHYLHCLHNLWKTHYPEFYAEEAAFAQDHREEWLEHVDHCVDMLRQKLVCDADPGLVTYSWLKNHYNPHPNFNVEHKCRSYDRLMAAAERYGVDMGTLPEGGIRRPAGEEVVEFVEPPFDPSAVS